MNCQVCVKSSIRKMLQNVVSARLGTAFISLGSLFHTAGLAYKKACSLSSVCSVGICSAAGFICMVC